MNTVYNALKTRRPLVFLYSRVLKVSPGLEAVSFPKLLLEVQKQFVQIDSFRKLFSTNSHVGSLKRSERR